MNSKSLLPKKQNIRIESCYNLSIWRLPVDPVINSKAFLRNERNI
jgi:hypothetical protein